jgi:hypothetical protein
MRLGCATDDGAWAAARVQARADAAVDAAMRALQDAKRHPAPPPDASPCRAISSF